MPNIFIHCPHCATLNNIGFAGIPTAIDVNCSHCTAGLGTWRDLAQALGTDAEAVHLQGDIPATSSPLTAQTTSPSA